MSGSKRKLTTKKRSAIEGLLTGKTILQVAESVGVSERTLYRWLSEETFSAELRKVELQVLDAVAWQLIGMSRQATDALQDVLEKPSQKGGSVKRLTAKDILTLLLDWREQVDLEHRIERLERKVFNAKV